MRTAFLLAALLLAATADAQTIRYVDPAATGAADGTSWANAYPDLQAALTATAAGSNTELWVKAGTHKPTTGADRTATFALKSGVALYGGFAGTETQRSQRNVSANVTTLSGDIGTAAVATDNAHHVVTANDVDASAVLDGFSVTGGYANGTPSFPGSMGGGLYVQSASPTVRNVIVRVNHANTSGGGLYVAFSGATFHDVTVEQNTTLTDGTGAGLTVAGAGTPTFTGLTVQNNVGPSPFRIVSGPNVTVTNATVQFNTSLGPSGALILSSATGTLANVTVQDHASTNNGNCGGLCLFSSNTTLRNVTVQRNHAPTRGGGIYMEGGTLVAVGLLVQNNSAGLSGGGFDAGSGANVRLYGARVLSNATTALGTLGSGLRLGDVTARIVNSVIAGNQSTQQGQGAGLGVSGTLLLQNSVVVANTARRNTGFDAIGGRGGGLVTSSSSAAVTITNSIIWANAADNSAPAIHQSVGTLTVEHSNVQGGWAGTGNVNVDPVFVGTGTHPYRLLEASTLLHAGSNAALLADTDDLDGDGNTLEAIPTDMLGAARVQGAAVAMGAYETPVDQTIADLTLTASATPGAVPGAGAAAAITLTLANAGPEATSNLATGTFATVSAPLPAGFAFVSASGAGTYDAGTGLWTPGNVASGGTASVTLNVTVNATGILTAAVNGPTDLVDATPASASASVLIKTIRYVNPAATGANDGTSWTNAYTDLRAAITASAVGTELWVKAGTYKPTSGADRTLAFEMKSGVAVYGGFAGTETARSQRDPLAHVTTLSGDLGTQGVATDNSYNVVRALNVDLLGSLDGFTVTGGRADGSGGTNSIGGGLYASGGTPTLHGLIVTGNYGAVGGGVHFTGNAAPSVANVLVTANSGLYGPAIFTGSGTAPAFRNVTVAGNAAGGIVGAAIYVQSTYAGVTMANSIVASNGGASFNIDNAALAVTYSLIQGGFAGTGNLATDPRFVNSAGGDFRLYSASAAVDAGANAALAPDRSDTDGDDDRGEALPLDLRRVVRVAHDGTSATVNMGAYEAVVAAVSADLTLTSAVTPASYAPGENAVVTLTLANAGPQAAPGVTVAVTIPAGLTFVSASGSGSYASGVWSPASVASGGSAQLALTLTANAIASVSASVTGPSNLIDDTPATTTAGVAPVALGTGPGGVSDVGGVGALRFWGRADAGTFSGSDCTGAVTTGAVGCWQDRSGYGNHVTQTTSGNRPELGTTSSPVVRPALTFPNAASQLSRAAAVTASQSATVIAVSATTSTSAAQTIVYNGNPGGNGYGLYHLSGGRRVLFGGVAVLGSLASTTGWQAWTFHRTTGSVGALFVNGAADFDVAISAPAPPSGLFLVGNDNGGTARLQGGLAEALVYDRALTAAERTLVHSYLAARYGLTITGTRYAGPTTHATDVAGIGRESDGSNLRAASGGLALADGGALDANGDFLVAGHDAATDWSSSDVPAGTTRRAARTWFFDATGSTAGATATLTFDLSDVGIAGAATQAADYRLLRRSGAGGTFASVATATGVVGDRVTFSMSDAALTDGHYTLGDAALPLVLAGGAGTGPGGVGSTDGTSSLRAWLRADAGTLASDACTGASATSGTAVGCWLDRSGYGHHVSQAIVSGRPTLSTGAGGHAALSFDGDGVFPGNGGVGDVLARSAGPVTTALSTTLVAVARKETQATFLDQAIVHNGDYFAGGFGLFHRNSERSLLYGGIAHNGGGAYAGGVTELWIGTRDAATGTGTFYVNGTPQTFATPAPAAPAGPFAVGGAYATHVGSGNPGGYSAYLNGRISEVAVYDRALTLAEVRLVESALGARYGIATAGSRYAGAATHGQGIVGIGRESDGTSLLATTGGLTVRDAGALATSGTYLMLGHDGATDLATSDLPVGLTGRSRRTWRVDATGGLSGDVQLTFDLSESGLSGSPSSAADYRLLWRSAASGAAHGGDGEGEGGKSASSSAMQAGEFTVVGTGGSLVGDQVSFVVPASSIPDGEIALGSAGGVLPVEMTAFAAASDGVRGVRLTWTTASETNNVGWHVEVQAAPAASASTAARAPGASEPWRDLGFVAGAGTTGEARSYGYEAGRLAPGAYRFRLRQVDTDGASAVSGEVEAVAGMAGAVLLTGPAPHPVRTRSRLVLTVRDAQTVRVEMFDALGRRVSVVYAGDVESLRPLELAVDAATLAPGFYVVRAVGASGFTATERVVVAR